MTKNEVVQRIDNLANKIDGLRSKAQELMIELRDAYDLTTELPGDASAIEDDEKED